jgi:Flp pilus assembly protein protease CpaA
MSLPTPALALDKHQAPTRRGRLWLAAWLTPIALAPVAYAIGHSQANLRPTTLIGLLLLTTVAVSAITDLRWRKIYNWATYPAVLWALVINVAATIISPSDGLSAFAFEQASPVGPAWLGAVGIWQSLSGALLCFCVLFVAFNLAGGGAGDVKIATVCGACLGMREGLLALAFCYLAAGAASVAWAVWKRGPVEIGSALLRKAGNVLLPGYVIAPDKQQSVLLEKPIPLGPFFAIGSVLALVGVMS